MRRGGWSPRDQKRSKEEINNKKRVEESHSRDQEERK